MKKRALVVSGLVALAALFLAPPAEASLTRATSPAIERPAITLASPAPAAMTEPSGFSLFPGDELACAAAEPGHAESFHPLAAVSLFSKDGADGPLVSADELSYPKTRVWAIDVLGSTLVSRSTELSLESHWACSGFSCGLASGGRKDPLGLQTGFEEYEPSGLQTTKRLSERLYLPQGPVYTQHLTAQAELADQSNSALARLGYGLLDVGVLPLAWAEEYGARGLLNLPYLVAHTTEYASDRLVQGIYEGDPAKVSEGVGGYFLAFFAAGTVFSPWSSDVRPPAEMPSPAPAPKPVSGETPLTRAGKASHKVLEDAHRRSGNFQYVNEPLRDEAGKPIQVARRVDLRTGEPLGTRTATPRPDAVRFENGGIILENKPVGRNVLVKDRQQIIQYISAYKRATGQLPRTIAVERYDQALGRTVVTDLYTPADFLPQMKK